jgi:hypothetical protein
MYIGGVDMKYKLYTLEEVKDVSDQDIISRKFQLSDEDLETEIKRRIEIASKENDQERVFNLNEFLYFEVQKETRKAIG